MDTESKTSGLKKKRRIFGWVFLASILVFSASNMVWTQAPMRDDGPNDIALRNETPPHTTSPVPPPTTISVPTPTTIPVPKTVATDTAVIVSVVSLLASVTSLIGFFSTTVLSWKKEKREIISSDLEIKKKELELEKLKIELARAENGEKGERT